MYKVDQLYDCKNTLGEGITYSSINNCLYWLDIDNISSLFKVNLSSNKKEIFNLPEIVTATSVRSHDDIDHPMAIMLPDNLEAGEYTIVIKVVEDGDPWENSRTVKLDFEINEIPEED